MMNKKKSTIISMVVLIIGLFAISLTLAWFTDNDITKNQIRVGEFGIEVIESSTNPDAMVNDKGIKYKNPVVIGQEKSKIVDIKNTKELSAFIRVTVEKVWLDENGNIITDKDPEKIVVKGIDSNVWIYQDSGVVGKAYYYLKAPLKANETVNLFKAFIIENNFVSHEETMSYTNLISKIYITTNAVQADDGLNAVAAKHWPNIGVVAGQLAIIN